MRMWCDLKTKKTVLSGESLNAIQEALSPMALYGLDRITSFHIVKYLYTLFEQLSEILCPVMTSLLNDITLVKTVKKTRLFRGVISDIRGHRGECDATFLGELSVLLERCGITDPFMKIYIRRETPQLLLPTMFLVLLAAISKFNGKTFSDPLLKKADSTDISAFCAGFACILLQFNVLQEFFALCNLYISTTLLTARGNMKQGTFMHTLRFIAYYSSLPLNVRL
uniref:Uncharacterized protein n=1 Tax=Brugia malayi TaxID=6279 RepID=A8Q3E0_BRUMA